MIFAAFGDAREKTLETRQPIGKNSENSHFETQSADFLPRSQGDRAIKRPSPKPEPRIATSLLPRSPKPGAVRRDAFPFLTTRGRTSWHPLLGKSKNRASQEHQAPSHSNRTRRNRRSPEIEAPKKRCRTVRQSLPHPRKISCRNTCPHRPPPRTRRPALPIRLHDKAPFRISGRPQTSPNSTPPPIPRTTQSLQLARSTRSHRRYCRALENRGISSRNMHAPKSNRTPP